MLIPLKVLRDAIVTIHRISPTTNINIDTNATLITDEIVEKLSGHVYQWNTTVDATVEKIHNLTRAFLTETLRGIAILKKHGERVSVNIVLSRINADEKILEKTIKDLKKLEVDRITISPAKDIGRGMHSKLSPLVQEREEYERIVSMVHALAKKYDAELDGWNDPRYLKKDRRSCFCGVLRVTVDWKGIAYPCELMPIYRQFLGTNLCTDANELRRKMWWWIQFTVIEPPVCSQCEYKHKCSKGCRFITYLSSDIPFAKPVLCKIKPNSIYEVVGYRPYVPLFQEGRLAFNNPLVKEIIRFISNYSDKIVELGAGAGRWILTIEKNTGKTVRGYEINKTMLELWRLVKERFDLKSEIFEKDAREAEKGGMHLLLDNFVTHFDKTDLTKIISKADKTVIEFVPSRMSDAQKTLKYWFNGKSIEETVIPIGKNRIRKIVYNGIASAEMEQYIYSLDDLKFVIYNAHHEIAYTGTFGRRIIILTERKG